MSDDFKRMGCDDIGPEECEERMDEEGLDMAEASRKHFGEFDAGR